MPMEAKPYKLLNKIQNYEWGTKNENAFIPRFLNQTPELDKPYAELWIGTHPKASSEIMIEGNKLLLSDIIKTFPKEILGERISKKFNKQLPFLLKILSIDKALSIQSHPDKKLAEILHSKDPKNYPDQNHKPEIAIAIDSLKAIVGMKSRNEIKLTLVSYYEIQTLLNDSVTEKLINPEYILTDTDIKEIYSQIMNAAEDRLEKCINNLVNRFSLNNSLSEAEKQFLIQYKYFGVDVGLISLLLFNLINLNEGGALFTPAGIPHAYIKGNIVECMANSDNVVRAGLTPKFKDINTLIEMLELNSELSSVNIHTDGNIKFYRTPAEEFQIARIILDENIPSNEFNNEEVNIFLILSGEISFEFTTEGGNKRQDFVNGDAVLIPAILKNYTIRKIKNSKIYSVTVP